MRTSAFKKILKSHLAYWMQDMYHGLREGRLQTQAVRISKCLGERFHEFRSFLESLIWPDLEQSECREVVPKPNYLP